MLLIEEMPLDERVRKGNVIYKTRTRDVEDTLAQLLHDEDQSIASAAIHLVESRGLWSLAGDLEHVLAHRDARDWHVFEAASWALAAHRMPAERRRALWQEPLPAVELADRLRRMPLFAFTSVDELFRIARLGRQIRHEAGHRLYERGTTPGSVAFLLDGEVSCRGGPRPRPWCRRRRRWRSTRVLEGAPMRAAITALEPSITLTLTTDEFLTLLSENVEMAQGLFRMLITRHGSATGDPVVRGTIEPGLTQRVATGAQAVDRVLLLQSNPLLARATAAQLWQLAAIAHPLGAQAGRRAVRARRRRDGADAVGHAERRTGRRQEPRRGGRRSGRHLRDARGHRGDGQGHRDKRRARPPDRPRGTVRPAGRPHRSSSGHVLGALQATAAALRPPVTGRPS